MSRHDERTRAVMTRQREREDNKLWPRFPSEAQMRRLIRTPALT
jgi:hypothetical protein